MAPPYTSVRLGAASPPTRIARSTRPAPDGSPTGTTTPKTDARHRTSAGHTTDAPGESSSRSHPDTTARPAQTRPGSRHAIAFDRSNAASSSAVCTCRYLAASRPIRRGCTEPVSQPEPPARTHVEPRDTRPPRRPRPQAGRRRGSHATHRRRPCDPTRPRPATTGRKPAVSDARPFALLRRLSPAQREFSRSFAIDLPSGGGGNRTRVRGRTGRTSTSVVRALVSPDGRFADDLPAGQPS